MGTRNLIAVMVNGEYKVAQYGQWDGYPDGQGVTVLSFLRKEENIHKLKEKLSNVRFLDEEKDKELIEEYDKAAEADTRTDEQKRWFKQFLSRDVCAKILQNIIDSDDKEILLQNCIEFSGDSLFCEWAYVIDFDKNTLEVYRGFNKETILTEEDRFFEYDQDHPHRTRKYYPVKLMKCYALDKLPTKKVFLIELLPDEEE